MTSWKHLSHIRRQYGEAHLVEMALEKCPFEHFKRWFDEMMATGKVMDPGAMVLSTVDLKGRPDSRVVLLKGIESGAFIFYTNYKSTKAQQLHHKAYAALNFFWPEISRQIRIRGRVKKVSAALSDAYFTSRPLESQVAAILSPQSQPIESFNDLSNQFEHLLSEYQQKQIRRPSHWGGYQVIPDEIEFWQGRNDRMHHRIHYFLNKGGWKVRALAP